MTLTSQESGILRHTKRSGAVLEGGCILAKLDLDDPSRVNRAVLYESSFEELDGDGYDSSEYDFDVVGAESAHTDSSSNQQKQNVTFNQAKAHLQHILAGYVLPEPYFSMKMTQNVENFINCLKDPRLPLLELQEIISSISGRIPSQVEKSIRKQMNNYASNITAILAAFPSQQIASVIDSYAATLQKRADRDVFFLNTQGIVQLVQRYRNGTRGRLRQCVQDMLKQYIDVEQYFQAGHYDKCVSSLREQYKDEGMESVVGKIFSHLHVMRKNQLIIKLIDHLCGQEPGITDELSNILNALTVLNKSENAKVALRARQVLISAHQPPFALRHNQMESIFLSAIDMYSHEFEPNVLNKLILSETSIFDVLHQFFYHLNVIVRRAALEVYVRRAHISYELVALQHLLISCLNHGVELSVSQFEQSHGVPTAIFHFVLPSSHPSMLNQINDQDANNTDNIIKPEDNKSVTSVNYRVGLIAAFNTIRHVEEHFDELVESLSAQGEELLNDQLTGDDRTNFSLKTIRENEDYIFIVNIAVKADDQDDMTLSKTLEAFCQTKKQLLYSKQIRRVTFIVCDKCSFPRYFTYRVRDDFVEDTIYRHLEPALAFQLEISRLRNYDLEAIPTANQKMHLYLGKAKVLAPGQQVTDFRFFVRTIIRHSDLVTKEASYEFLQNEGERLILEAMDELEVAFTHPSAKRTDCNHIFLNFVPKVTMDPTKIAENVRNMVMRYGPRLWKLRVLQAELRMTIRMTPNGKCIPFRLFLANESGYLLDMHLYKEVRDPLTGQMKFEAWHGISNKFGPLNDLPISSPYMTKDYLQLKRFQAQSNGTTYIYDFPGTVKFLSYLF